MAYATRPSKLLSQDGTILIDINRVVCFHVEEEFDSAFKPGAKKITDEEEVKTAEPAGWTLKAVLSRTWNITIAKFDGETIAKDVLREINALDEGGDLGGYTLPLPNGFRRDDRTKLRRL